MNDECEIRSMAELIWRCEGCPAGAELRHWHTALKLLESAALAPDRQSAELLRSHCPSLGQRCTRKR
jgi:hypothetical protein